MTQDQSASRNSVVEHLRAFAGRQAFDEERELVYGAAERIERLERELFVARAERQRSDAMREEAIKQLTGIWALLDPKDTQVGDKTMRFVNPHAAEVLHALSDRIRAIPEAMRSAPVSERGPSKSKMQEHWNALQHGEISAEDFACIVATDYQLDMPAER